jgi:ribosomal protein S15P/S13E
MAVPKKTEVKIPSAMPISFEQFSKDPVKGLLFIVLAAIGYLYVDGKMNYTKQIDACNVEVVVLNEKIDKLTEHIRRSDSTLGYMISKVEMLQILK